MGAESRMRAAPFSFSRGPHPCFMSLCCTSLLLPRGPGASWLSWPTRHQTLWLQAPPTADDLTLFVGLHFQETIIQVFPWDRNLSLHKTNSIFFLHWRLEQQLKAEKKLGRVENLPCLWSQILALVILRQAVPSIGFS